MCILSRITRFGIFSIALVTVIWMWVWNLWEQPAEIKEEVINTLAFESGDLIFRSTRSVEGETVLLLSGGDYSHVGIVSVKDDDVFVIHVLPSSPSVVREETLQKFVSESSIFAVYRVQAPYKLRQLAVSSAESWVGKKSFDRAFDLRDDTELYCTELVYDAYKKVGVDLVKGRYDIAVLPVVGRKEVIYPKNIIDAGSVKLVYKSSANSFVEYTYFRRLTMRKKLVLILVAVFVVLSLAGCSSGPDGAVKGFFKALDAGEVDKAMGYLSTSTLNALGHDKWQAALTSAVKDLQSKGGLSSVKVVDKKVHGDTAVVTVKLTFGDGSSETDTINLIKEDGDWKIQMTP